MRYSYFSISKIGLICIGKGSRKKQSFFSGPTTKRGEGGTGLATKKRPFLTTSLRCFIDKRLSGNMDTDSDLDRTQLRNRIRPEHSDQDPQSSTQPFSKAHQS